MGRVKVKNSSLIEAREKLDLNRKQLASLLGITYSTYAQYESFGTFPAREVQTKICAFYNERGFNFKEGDLFPYWLSQARSKRDALESKIPDKKIVLLSGINRRELPLVPSVEDEYIRRIENPELGETLESVLDTLSPREAYVIREYYELDKPPTSDKSFDEKATLERIGAHFGLTRERIRVIKDSALRRLRYASRRKVLEPFL